MSSRTRTGLSSAARRRRIVVRAVPQRTCVACRQVKAKRELIRVVRDSNGRLSVDLRGKASGRGAYLCPDEACLARGIDDGSLARALEVTIDEATRLRLRDELAAGAVERSGEGGRGPTEAAGPSRPAQAKPAKVSGSRSRRT